MKNLSYSVTTIAFYIFVFISAQAQVDLQPDSSNFQSKVTIDNILENNGLIYPIIDGVDGQVLGTDGSGVLGWKTIGTCSILDNYGYLCNSPGDYNSKNLNMLSDSCGNLYDSGGPNGDYFNDEDQMNFIIPSSSLLTCVILKKLNIEINRDTLWIQDNFYTGTISQPDTLVFSGDMDVNIHFKSDEVNVDSGFHVFWNRFYYLGDTIASPFAGFYFDPIKSSIGGGIEQDSAWSNSGDKSVFFGYGAQALGIQSISLGYQNLASASKSSAVGDKNEASGLESSALGSDNIASGQYSVACGKSTLASGLNSSALGSKSDATGDFSTAVGRLSLATGLASLSVGSLNQAAFAHTTAVGRENIASADSTTAIGVDNLASGRGASSFGNANTVSGIDATGIGFRNTVSGNHSTSIGRLNNSTAIYSSSVGNENITTGDRSSTFGHSNSASGSSSSAVGSENDAAGQSSTALGYKKTSTAQEGTAVGFSNNAGAFGSAFGWDNNASVGGSNAIGYQNEASGGISSAIGAGNEASSSNSLALGFENVASATESSALGVNTTSDVYKMTVIGRYNELISGSSSSWVSTNPVFVVGIGENGLNKKNGLVIRKNGNLGIGTNNPSHKLHLSTDDAAKPSTNTWTVASDARLKTDIEPFIEGIETLSAINPVWFSYTGEAEMPQDRAVGVIAQDLQKTAPHMVTEWTYINSKDGSQKDYLGVNNGAMTYMLINAVKEQQEIIEELREEIQELKKFGDEYQELLNRVSLLEEITVKDN